MSAIYQSPTGVIDENGDVFGDDLQSDFAFHQFLTERLELADCGKGVPNEEVRRIIEQWKQK